MRFLANENIPLLAIRLMRQAGHEVIAVIETAPASKDDEVLAWARREQCYILTFDRDYGDLVFKRRLPPPIAIIYFRFVPLTPQEPATYLFNLLQVKGLILYCVSNENYTFGIGVRNHLRTARKELRTPDC